MQEIDGSIAIPNSLQHKLIKHHESIIVDSGDIEGIDFVGHLSTWT
jgi:hypothetical protein